MDRVQRRPRDPMKPPIIVTLYASIIYDAVAVLVVAAIVKFS